MRKISDGRPYPYASNMIESFKILRLAFCFPEVEDWNDDLRREWKLFQVVARVSVIAPACLYVVALLK